MPGTLMWPITEPNSTSEPARCRAHERDRVAGHVDRAGEVGAQHTLEDVGRHLLGTAVGHDARAVDDRVDAAVP